MDKQMSDLTGIKDIRIDILVRSEEGQWVKSPEFPDQNYFRPKQVYHRQMMVTPQPDSKLEDSFSIIDSMLLVCLREIDRQRLPQPEESDE